MKWRTRYIIYPSIQYAILGANLIAWCLFVISMFIFVDASKAQMQGLGKSAGLPADHVYYRFIEMQTKALAYNLTAGAMVALVLSSLFLIWFSHRLVGPVVALTNYLNRVASARAKGEATPGPLKFRKGDHFQEILKALNGVIQSSPDKK